MAHAGRGTALVAAAALLALGPVVPAQTQTPPAAAAQLTHQASR